RRKRPPRGAGDVDVHGPRPDVRRRARRLSATVCALVGVACSVGAAYVAYSSTNDDALAAGSAPATAVFSPRRGPELLHDAIADARLGVRLDGLLNTLSPTTCLSISDGDAPVYARNPDQLLIPASTLKLTTAAAFLSKVGGKGTFSTVVRGARPDAGGV